MDIFMVLVQCQNSTDVGDFVRKTDQIFDF